MKYSVPLKQNRDFRRLYARGRSAASSSLAVYCQKNRSGIDRLGITVGRKLGNAVVRNRLRRRIREIYRLHEHLVSPGWDIVVVGRVRAIHAPYRVLQRDFLSLAGKLGLLRTNGPS